MSQRYPCRISAQHPSLPGHFPGHPVVPGVVLLSEVGARVRDFLGHPVRITGAPTVKFTHPLLPDTDFEIVIESGKTSAVKFQCLQDSTQLASGSLTYVPV